MTERFSRLRRIYKALVIMGITGLFVAVGVFIAGVVVVLKYGSDLPDHRELVDYKPPVTTRVHAGDGRLIAEFATEKRIFVPIESIPKHVQQAFVAAEDQRFYTHSGVDYMGILRAALQNLKNVATDKRLVGGSTITQQVAKNFLLSNEKTIKRKIKEALLAYRIEDALSKARILELYLNEIYLGQGTYGVAAAALEYFDKSLEELTLGEAAYLAALPKAPNNYHPTRHYAAAKARRDWVIGRMLEEGFISANDADTAASEELRAVEEKDDNSVRADFFAEEIRRQLADIYGVDQLYAGGYSVRSSLEPKLQRIARRVLREGLEAYDRRHGWRGPVTRIEDVDTWKDALPRVERPGGASDSWRLAVVLRVSTSHAEIGLTDGSSGRIPLAELKWARAWKEEQKLGPQVSSAAQVLKKGDVVLVEKTQKDAGGKDYPQNTYGLRQIPEINGALVAMDPHTGRVLAMVGGYSFERSQFNRATQAMRQPGSAFKPIVYLAATSAGYSPSTLILDAPFVIDQGPGKPKWRPDNYTKKFYGPSTMRLGIEKSRNLMTVRLAQKLGMDRISDMAERLGVVDHLPQELAMALGAGETTLLKLTAAYSMIVNGGKKIEPTFIDRIQNRNGKTVFKHDDRPCEECRTTYWEGQSVPVIPDTRDQVADPASTYQVVHMMEGVVQRGTGVRVRAVGKPLAGKTGTTNESRDTWFLGFSPDLAVGVFVGFDTPRTLGKRETGSSVAVPIFRDFMMQALENEPATPFRIPSQIRLVRVNAKTGKTARPGDENVILEAFKPGQTPSFAREERPRDEFVYEDILPPDLVIDGSDSDQPALVPNISDSGGLDESSSGPSSGTGGLY